MFLDKAPIKVFEDVKVVPFEGWHLEWLAPNQDAMRSMMNLPTNAIDHGKVLATYGRAWTGLRKGRVIGSAGIIPLQPGVYDLWMYLGSDTFDKKKLAMKIFKYYLFKSIKELKIHRLQAVVKEDYCQGIRFAEFFGFENEGVMKCYGPNKENFIRYAKT